ncbi:MAG TPA: ammonium transporter, partial [Rubrobacteraceae bacterium]|nr:ammonium transporter [Rubrobacteraceae bacterium]
MRKFILLMITVLLLIAAVPAAAFAQETPVTAGTATPEDVALAVDTMWVVLAAMLVLFMQAGFAMLEVGFSRMK